MVAPPRWGDDRLDDLNAKVRTMEPLVAQVAVMQSEMKTLTSAVQANTTATEHVAEQLEDASNEPFVRGREKRSQIVVVLVGAGAGGGLAILGAVIGHVLGA